MRKCPILAFQITLFHSPKPSPVILYKTSIYATWYDNICAILYKAILSKVQYMMRQCDSYEIGCGL